MISLGRVVEKKSGKLVPAQEPGSATFEALFAAPGTYIKGRIIER